MKSVILIFFFKIYQKSFVRWHEFDLKYLDVKAI